MLSKHKATFKTLAIAVSLVMLLTLVPALPGAAPSAGAVVHEGKISNQLTWSLDTETGQLAIKGKGAMPDYGQGNAPWQEYWNLIQDIRISRRVTSIGNNAFSGLVHLTEVSIDGRVGRIGDYAFASCQSLASVSIGGRVASIGDYAFAATALTKAMISRNVKSFGSNIFEDCDLAGLIITGYYSSDAQKYAVANGIRFEEFDDFVEVSSLCGKGVMYLSEYEELDMPIEPGPNAEYSVITKPGQADKWKKWSFDYNGESEAGEIKAELKELTFLSKLLNKGWVSLKFRTGKNDATIIEFPAVEKRAKTGTGLGGAKPGVWYPSKCPGNPECTGGDDECYAWCEFMEEPGEGIFVIADKNTFKNGKIAPIPGLEFREDFWDCDPWERFEREGGESDPYERWEKKFDEMESCWEPLDEFEEGFELFEAYEKERGGFKSYKMTLTVREPARVLGGKIYPGTKPMKLKVSSIGAPPKYSFKGRELKLKNAMYYIDGEHAVAGPVSGKVDFSSWAAGTGLCVWTAPTGKKPPSMEQELKIPG
ncbi:MAG: leucine-rich repeat domain-containing protein [Oscillospiraceae bacterium]|nr:leucine-rich repeat domain-containing protein [Oscillospiraceae bacterium]